MSFVPLASQLAVHEDRRDISAVLQSGVETHSMTTRQEQLQRAEFRQLRKLRIASLLEACSLVVLLFVAVPLKHLSGWPAATSFMGPLHGLTFLFYLYVVIETVSGGEWTRKEIARLVLLAFVPFGGFANLPWLKRRASQYSMAQVRS
jgi:integral membrane protein